MLTKVYLSDWFFNAGIIGFLRILEDSKDNFAIIKDNYIEFDTKNLSKFHEYYFNYFFEKYNIARTMKERIDKSFSKIKGNLAIESQTKEEEKDIKEKIKLEIKYIKQALKVQMDKIKKIDEEIYTSMIENYNLIDKICTKEEMEKLNDIATNFNNYFSKEHINKKITMNYFKSILSNNYFGQASFFNVVKNSCSFEEQKEIMYKDYISNIIECDFLQDILSDKFDIDEISKYIDDKKESNLINEEISKSYKTILNKYIQKGKNIEDIKDYIRNEVFSSCSICGSEHFTTDNYTEGNFIPLAMSSENAKNYFWNQNVKYPICDVCKLIMFCIPVGITSIIKTVKENENGKTIYKEKEKYCFINYDTDIESLLIINNSFRDKSKMERSISNPYTDLILDIVEQEKKLSEWKLQNIFVIEFEAVYREFSRIEYFNIKRYVANFFTNYAGQTLNIIKDRKYKLQVVDYILKNKDMAIMINGRIRESFKNNDSYGFNSFIATKIRMILEILKKGELELEENIKKNNNKLIVLYNLGTQIHMELKNSNQDNKLDGYTYKLLNSIKAGNKKEFMDIVIRIHMSMGKDVSPIFLEVMKDGELDLASVGHSFVSGLISNKYEKNEEVKKYE